MTFDEYINNPMGIKNAVYSHREMYRELYKGKFNTIMMREAGNIKYKLYRGTTNFYIYIKIPSEIIEKFYYDVVIQFTPVNDFAKNDNTLKNYNVRFFSNDPSFVFTFAYAMKTNDMFIKDLSSKMSKQALTTLAKERNPSNQPGYVKSIYFAYLTMKTFGLFDKKKYTLEGNLYNKLTLLPMIMNADEKIDLRQKMGLEKQKKKREAIKKIKASSEQKTTNAKNKVSFTHKTNVVKRNNLVSHSKKIKKI